MFVDGGLAGRDGLLGKDLRHLGRVGGEVVSAFPNLRDLFKHTCIGAIPDGHRRDGHLGRRHLLCDAFEVSWIGDTIGEKNGVFEPRLRALQDLEGLLHRRVHIGPSGRLDSGDLVDDLGLVVCALHLADDIGFVIEGQYGDLIVFAQQFYGGPGCGFGHLDAIPRHRARTIDDQYHSQRGFFFLFFKVAAHGKDLFERGLVVTS